MDEQDLGDWDEEFLEAAIKAEEVHLSSQLQSPPPPAPATISSFLAHAPQQQPSGQRQETPALGHLLSYSPPRELSQRAANSNDAFVDRSISAVAAKRSSPVSTSRRSDSAKDFEIDRLTRELRSVSRQLLELEQEHSQLRKGIDKETKSRPSHVENKWQDANVRGSKRPNSESGLTASANDGLSREVLCAKALEDRKYFKAIGLQADLPNHADLSKKFLDIWYPSSCQDLGRNLIPELMAACSTDFHILFSFMTINNMSFSEVGNSMPENSLNLQSSEALEATKVSHLYSAITKISYGILDLKALFEPLLDLCQAKNGLIVHRSLHILYVLLKHICGVEKKSDARNNVTDAETNSTDVAHFYGSQSRGQTSLNSGESATSSHIAFWPRFVGDSCKRGPRDADDTQLLGHICWLSLFEFMNQIANRRTEEHVKLEAVSVMKIIVMRTDAYGERRNFCSSEVVGNLSLLLKKQVGLRVRKEAVHLLYLLLNCKYAVYSVASIFDSLLNRASNHPNSLLSLDLLCFSPSYFFDTLPVWLFLTFGESHFFPQGPKLLGIFDASWEEGARNENEENLLVTKAFGMIFEGLADCLVTSRETSEDLELCRNVVMVLAFLASSGNSGFEVLTTHNVSQDTNFLMLILKLLATKIDSETTVTASPEPAETFKPRTLLMREILILLNRLVSGPSSSSTILRELTKSRDMASLTIYAAARLSCKRQIFRQSDSAARRMRESEITDLARIFKKRVFAYLGDTIS